MAVARGAPYNAGVPDASTPPAAAVADRTRRTALAALVVGGACIAASPILVRLSEIGPAATAFHRAALAVPMLWLWCALARARGRPPLGPSGAGAQAYLAFAGVFFAGDLLFWHWSIGLTSIANATLFANFNPLFVALGAWVLLGQPIRLGFAIGMAVAFAGAALLLAESLAAGEGSALGDVFGLITAAFWASFFLAVARFRRRYDPATIMLWTSIGTALAILPVAAVAEDVLFPTTLAGWGVLLALALVSHALGQGLIAFAVAHLPAGLSALTLLLEPVFAALFGWVLLGEALSPLQGTGGMVILAGILLAQRQHRPARPVPVAGAEAGP